MKKRISVRIFLIQWLSLVIMVICGEICYECFFPIYYKGVKNRQIMEAYQDIEDVDLANLEEDYAVFTEYENLGLSFTIADEDMSPIYATRENPEYAVFRNIEMKKDRFSGEPQIIGRNSKLKETAKLRVILTQNQVEYYVVIKDATGGTAATKMSERFLTVVFVVIFGIGSFVMMLFSKRMTRPITDLAKVAEKVAGLDFSQRAKENGEYTELNRLAKSINHISSQFQDSIGQIDESRERQLRQNVRQERMEKLQKDFIANISHELKTPLAIISSQAEMIQYVGEEERDEYLSSIQEEVKRMSGLVSGLLDASVMEHQMESMIQKPLNMKEIMEYIMVKYEGLAKKKKLHLDHFLESDCVVYGDREYVEQAVSNFMMNAFDHTQMGGSIRVTLRKEHGSVRVGVYNSGKQIAAEDMEHIWNGFYSKNRKGSDGLSHAGLGLHIVQNVVTMHNGRYGVENFPEGVEFWFTIPEVGKLTAMNNKKADT